MKSFILVYTLCKNKREAEKIGMVLLKKKLCACINTISNVNSFYLWPAGTNKIENSKETILLIKSLEEKYSILEKEILRLHSYKLPCIFAVKLFKVFEGYGEWLKSELK